MSGEKILTHGPRSYLEFSDDSAMTDNDAHTVPSQKSVKAYVDSVGTSAIGGTTISSISAAASAATASVATASTGVSAATTSLATAVSVAASNMLRISVCESKVLSAYP
jgi:hypothetical protein